MGLFELLLLFFFIVLPVLNRLMEKRKEGQRGPQGDHEAYDDLPQHSIPRPHWEEEDEVVVQEDPLADALRQIREALGQPSPEPEPVAPAPEPVEPPKPRHSPAVEARMTDMGESKLREARRPMKVESLVHSHARLSPLGRELQTPESARRAVIMKEVLDGPPSRRFRSVLRR